MIPIRDSIRSGTTPVVTYAFIFINVAAFLYEASLLQQGSLEAFVMDWGAVPARFNLDFVSPATALSQSPTLITSLFLHGSWMHLIGNMLFLFVFGDNVEDRLGHLRYGLFYLICGVSASVAQLIFDLTSTIPIVGASGAIGGVMGAYLVLFPHAQVLTLVPIFFFIRFIWLPALLFLGIWFVLQLVYAVAPTPMAEDGGGGGIAFWAHVGGFAAGAVLAFILGRRKGRRYRDV